MKRKVVKANDNIDSTELIMALNDLEREEGINKEKPAGYYVGSRNFELPEVKLLVDAVQASKFITEKKSRELIKKLEKLIFMLNLKL